MASRPARARRPAFRKEIKIEGVMLHARTIIEQGRTQEFLAALKESGFEIVKGQPGLIKFVREFIASSPEAARTTAITGERATTFTAAVSRKGVILDDC